MKIYNFCRVLSCMIVSSIVGNTYPIILNEYNGVALNYKLKNGGYDSYYGRINGNGSSWLEMVIVKDKTDIRNAILKITGHGGTYFKGKIPNYETLSKLRSGTILTISKEQTNLSYDPFNKCSPDWTININSNDLTTIDGVYDINHNELKISIKSEDDHTLMKDSGEGIFGGGIDKREIFLLKEKEPTEDILPNSSSYGDNGYKQPLSTFGSPNQWIDSSDTIITQNLNELRRDAKSRNFRDAKSYLILNEYSAVASDKFLKNGGTDSYFGRVLGNGGSWLELIVIKDRLNLHNAKIKIEEGCNEIFSAKFPELKTIGYLRKGTMLTLSNEPTNMSYFPFAPYSGDWRLNLNINDLVNKSGEFLLSSENSVISITNEDGTKFRLTKTGEGVRDKYIIDNEEVYKLKANPTIETSPYNINYGDDNNQEAISTFGSPNRWRDENSNLITQQMTIRENENLEEIDGIVLSDISDLNSLKDSESLLYISSNNSLWITDDDSHQVFEMDYSTQEIKSVFNDIDLGEFTNGDIQDHCGSKKGACDIEEVAYDNYNDILYILTGKSPGTPAIYKLTRDSIDKPFQLNDYRKLDSNTEYPSAIFINGDFIVSIGKKLYKYDFETNTIEDNPIFSIDDDVGDFVGLAYHNGTLWITTIKNKSRLIKVNWSNKSVEAIYKMSHNGVFDPRGIEIINNKLHILEGYDTNVPKHHTLKNAIHIYNMP